jgi:hypothetical protein
MALKTLYGGPVRELTPLIHLWHPEPVRISRNIGSLENDALLKRWTDAARYRDRINLLVKEVREEWSRIRS